ncbi:MAG: hypothetical protein P4M04_08600 [Acidobacteriota bacterium]|nr:hypothetical protein [Acidobacteriota bacterium]
MRGSNWLPADVGPHITPKHNNRSPVVTQALFIGLITFVSYAYFHAGGGWNQNSRLDLVRAIVERRTLRIDAYHENTSDKAVYQGHFYSDKAPGQSFLAVPAAVATRSALDVAGISPGSARGVIAMAYFSSLFSVALPFALDCTCLFLIALKLRVSIGAGTFAAIAMGLGTPLWAYSILFWAHALVGASLLFSFGAALMLNSKDGGANVRWGVAVGLMAGCATLAEYPAAPAAILAVFALARVWSGGWQPRVRVAGAIPAGAVPCVIALMAYQHAAFGSAFQPSYSYYGAGAFPWMRHGYFGLKYPRLDVAFKLLFGAKRGLLFCAPLALVAPLGLRLLWQRPETRSAAKAASAIFLYLLNAAFPVWPAGWSWGPRYMSAGIPFLCIGLAPAWDYFQQRGKLVLLTLLAVSILVSLVAVSTTLQPPDSLRSPLTQYLWPSFWKGQLSLEHISMLGPARKTRPIRTAPSTSANSWDCKGYQACYHYLPFGRSAEQLGS